MKRTREYSIRRVVSCILALLIVMGIVMMSWIALYISNDTQKKAYERLENLVRVNTRNLMNKIDGAEDFITELYYYSADITLILSEGEQYEIINGIARLKRMLRGIYPGFSGVDGFFLYFPQLDRYVSATGSQRDSQIADSIKTLLRDRLRDGTSNPVNNTWQLLDIDGSQCLYFAADVQSIVAGAFLRLDTVMQAVCSPYHAESRYLLYNEDGGILYQSVQAREIPLPDGARGPTTLDADDGTRYYVFPINDLCTERMAALIPAYVETVDLRPMYIALTALMGLVALTAITTITLFSRMILKPTRELNRLNQQIQQSEELPDMRFPRLACVELRQTIDTVEHLCNSVAQLQARYYQEKLTRSKIELARLKSQVAPHFLVNCLYALQQIVESGHQDSAAFSTIIQTLSEHLRYSLNDQEIVPLEDEIYYVTNYIKLTQTRFPLCLTFHVHMDDEARRASVFPLILLMLTENSIKYNMTMGEPLRIDIAVELFERDGQKRVRLRHHDTGTGFSPEVLDAYRGGTLFALLDGKHIGMFNVMKRMELLFPSGSVRLYNQDGAVIEIEIPYRPYAEETMP